MIVIVVALLFPDAVAARIPAVATVATSPRTSNDVRRCLRHLELMSPPPEKPADAHSLIEVVGGREISLVVVRT
jgi:hypothetical protein